MSSVWCLVCEIQCVISSVWCRLCDVECVMSSGWCRVWLECVMSSVWYPVCDIQSKICYIFFNRWKRWSLNFCKLHQLIWNPLNPLNHHLHVMSSSPSPLTHIVQRGWSSLGSSWAPAQRAFTTWWQLGRPAGPPLPPPCKPAPHGGVGTWQQGSRRTCVSTFTFIIKCQLHLHVTSTSFKVFTGPWCSCCSTGATVFLIFTSSPPSPLHLQKSLGTCFSPSPPLPAGPLPPISQTPRVLDGRGFNVRVSPILLLPLLPSETFFLVAAVFSAPICCRPPEAAANGAILDRRLGPVFLVSWVELLSSLLSELGQRS